MGYIKDLDYPYYRRVYNDTVVVYETDSKNKLLNKTIYIKVTNSDSLYVSHLLDIHNCIVISNLSRVNDDFVCFALNNRFNYIMKIEGGKEE